MREERWVVERGLQLCTQNALEVATHLAASAGRDVPDYATAIDQLSDLGVLPAQFAARFRPVAGFRNVLVHGYLDVDLTIVYRLLNDRLDDFVEFARLVSHYLDTRTKPWAREAPNRDSMSRFAWSTRMTWMPLSIGR